MKIKVKKIIDKSTQIPINSAVSTINRIKKEFATTANEPEMCEVPVLDMWEENN